MNLGQALRQVVILKADRGYQDSLRREVLRLWPNVEVLAFASGLDALAAIQERGAQLLITGVKIKDMDGLEHLEPFAEKPIKIVIVTGRRDERTCRLLKQVRFDAIYDSFSDGLDTFPDCLEMVMAGCKFVSATLQKCLLEPKRVRNDDVLTPSEELVLSMIGDGCDDGVAAEHLAKTANSIHVHRTNIMRKLRLHHRGELVRWAVQRGYVVFDQSGIQRPGFHRVLAKKAATASTMKSSEDLGHLKKHKKRSRIAPLLTT